MGKHSVDKNTPDAHKASVILQRIWRETPPQGWYVGTRGAHTNPKGYASER